MTTLCSLLLTLAVFTPQTPALQLGDPAPPLKIAEWIKGDPVEIKPAPASRPEGTGPTASVSNPGSPGAGHVYLLEFWATWCAPCRLSIPHLTELQKKYKDKGLIVIGISDEPPALLNIFLKQMGDKIGYTIAADKRQATFRAYLAGVGVQGIPHTFIIDRQGRLAWHGSPFSVNDVLDAIMVGTYNIEARLMLKDYFETLFQAANTSDEKKKAKLVRDARQTGDKLLVTAGDDYDALDLLAWNILALEGLKTRDRELANNAIKRALELSKGKDAAVLDTYARALWDAGEKTEAVKQLKKAIDLADNEQIKSIFSDRLKTYERQLN